MDKSSKCTECSKSIRDKKIFECLDCSEEFCKDHVKQNETDHSILCFPCFKKKIHLEVTLEMENETLSCKSELETLKAKLKTCKKDLESKKTTIERCENQIKINEKTYLRKFENLEKRIEEEVQRSTNLENTVNSFEETLKDCKQAEESSNLELASTKSEQKSVQSELDSLRHETNLLKQALQEASDKSKHMISYNILRTVLCNICKNKIKLAFREAIVDGNKDRLSLVQSVMAERERMSLRQMPEEKKDEKACCLIY